MKRYLAFMGEHYYPAGGMEDFVASFDSQDEAVDYIIKRSGKDWMYTWAHIYDMELYKIVWRNS